MQNTGIKILLNREILGEPPVQQERRFSRIPAANLQPPAYNAKYFETLPTMWAEAYTFQRAIERGDRAALEEWVSLFLLDYFGVIHLKRYEKSTLVQEYDPDLWPAISGTYPNPKKESIDCVELLESSSRGRQDEAVVGAFYPGIIFFPSRNRGVWSNNENLSPYLEGDRLSWKKCCELMLQDNHYRRSFYLHLMSVAAVLELHPRTALLDFCTQEPIFRGQPTTPTEALKPDPIQWERPYKVPTGDPGVKEKWLKAYPLKKVRKGGTTYYLVTDLPVGADWMRTAIAPGLPAPNQYERVTDSKIKVRFGGQEFNIELEDRDQVVLLKDLFLDKNPYYCAVNKGALEPRTAQIRRLHKQEIINNTGAFTQLKPNDIAVCLAPTRSDLFAHFPEILHDPIKYVSMLDRTDTGGLSWEFTLFDRGFVIPTHPTYSKALPDSSLAIWPPKVSPHWSLYVAHGTGAKKETCGRWHLIAETGKPGDNVELNEGAAADEYVNILNAGGNPNRPMALMLQDGSGNERGVFFLAGLDEESGASHEAALAMDFGTSNSCLAFGLEGVKPEPLLFELSPRMLWGEPPVLENPGFVPFKWGGRKGYFPTILLSRKNTNLNGVTAGTLEARHLFTTDVPGLHREMEQSVFDGTHNANWDIHTDLKWHPDPRHPWARPAFLGNVLLYAHAELFFRHRVKINRYVFTFPLAFLDHERSGFHDQVRDVVKSIRGMCYGKDDVGNYEYDDRTDESTAIAKSVAAATNKAVVEVFVDIGGGTTDIAIRYDGNFVVLDSVRMAGKSFFIFSDKNFDSGTEPAGHDVFKRHLGKLLLNVESDRQVAEYVTGVKKNRIDLGTFYSLAINRLDDNEFKSKESGIRQHGMGHPSYQLYRSELFFRHVLAYALLQACAVVADKKLTDRVLTSGIKLILSGNGWGLMVFAELPRLKTSLKEEAQRILNMLKAQLVRSYDRGEDGEEKQLERASIERLKIFDVDLLNESNLSKAKTDVSVGALTNITQRQAQLNGESTSPYSGITLRAISINDSEPVSLRWCERWGTGVLREKIGLQTPRLSIESLDVSAPESYEVAMDPHLSVFTSLGGSNGNDPMPPEEWQKMNGLLCDGSAYIAGNKLARSPINYFVSRILYPEDMEHIFLNRLAAINKTLR